MLVAMSGTQVELAQKFGVGRRTWIRWCNGESTPGAKERARVHEEGGPPPEAWDELLPEGAPAPRPRSEPPGPLEPASAEATRELAAQLHRMAQEQIRALQDAGAEDPKLLSKMSSLADIVVQLGKLTGAAGIDEKRIVASPAWGRVWDRMCAALAPWPDAVAACAAALEGAAP